jgi:hypothetical protein
LITFYNIRRKGNVGILEKLPRFLPLRPASSAALAGMSADEPLMPRKAVLSAVQQAALTALPD